MDHRLEALYHIPNITDYEDICLQTLREHCASLENRLQELSERLSEQDRQIIKAYLDIRDELEFQSVKTALRWEKGIIDNLKGLNRNDKLKSEEQSKTVIQRSEAWCSAQLIQIK